MPNHHTLQWRLSRHCPTEIEPQTLPECPILVTLSYLNSHGSFMLVKTTTTTPKTTQQYTEPTTPHKKNLAHKSPTNKTPHQTTKTISSEKRTPATDKVARKQGKSVDQKSTLCSIQRSAKKRSRPNSITSWHQANHQLLTNTKQRWTWKIFTIPNNPTEILLRSVECWVNPYMLMIP